MLKQTRRAAVLVEMALAIPILLFVTFGLIEYSWMFLKANAITNAARQGARIAALRYSTEPDVRTAVKQRMNAAGITNYDLTIVPALPSEPQPGQTQPPPFDVGTPMTVTISVKYKGKGNLELLCLHGSFLPVLFVPDTLSAAVTMGKE